ncbi:hypothetical protein FIV42_10345 [Persicimonas caeni]|uniref:Uncharacterized protein n=1 Tax=Persicimonas caeni TaxID=2292766 RepID=A0A4Y6PSM8_PERCE|nr:hypothetical protein [Persicimonas caeni]QDG51119.1 hypothetical protein FIV42_10345 [Persicimonas caeni]QED32340.1 hypothetical protein FRD00_10340 [Persicimonas caeni]
MQESPRQKGAFATLTTKALLHAAAVAILATGTLALFSSEASWEVVGWAWQRGELAEAVLGDVGIHVGLCAIVWAVLAWCFSRLHTLVDTIRADERPRVKLAAERGTVLTETLIVLPVALLLIMGIAQLTLMNIAVTLSDLAVMQASRAVWVWAPEAEEGRFGVDNRTVEEKARVAAAAVMAPTASSDFGRFNTAQHAGYARTFRKAMGAMYGTTLEHGGTDVGSYSTNEAELKLSAQDSPIGENMAFNLAFDSAEFQTRSARKFFNAWAQTEIEITETNDWVGAKMTHYHMCLMPLVAGIFGEHMAVHGQDGYYVEINRAYSLPKQLNPNANLPQH